MIRIGIFGTTGYAGYELVKTLARHPAAEVVFAASESHAGKMLAEVYPTQLDLALCDSNQAPLDEIDIAFTCTPNGVSAPIARQVLEAGAKCIDFSADLRLHDPEVYAQWYGKHPAPDLLPQAVYGLCEVYRAQIRDTMLVANPGCYTTCALLALYPLARGGMLGDSRIIIDAKSGVSGAGVKPTETTHFCNVHDNFSAYKVGRQHRHVPEIEQELALYTGCDQKIIFTPHLLPVARGILSTIYVSLPQLPDEEALHTLLADCYHNEPFIQLLPLGQGATLAHSVGSNRCTLSVHSAGTPGEYILISTLDNLIKGAAGQAVQNMNILFGIDETTGLV